MTSSLHGLARSLGPRARMRKAYFTPEVRPVMVAELRPEILALRPGSGGGGEDEMPMMSASRLSLASHPPGDHASPLLASMHRPKERRNVSAVRMGMPMMGASRLPLASHPQGDHASPLLASMHRFTLSHDSALHPFSLVEQAAPFRQAGLLGVPADVSARHWQSDPNPGSGGQSNLSARGCL